MNQHKNMFFISNINSQFVRIRRKLVIKQAEQGDTYIWTEYQICHLDNYEDAKVLTIYVEVQYLVI